MKIVSFNIRCAWEQDINGFLHRAGIVYERIKAEQPDIIGLQEVTENILDMMEKLFPDYNFTGHGRFENYDGEGLYIATRKDSCDVLSFDSFWLSDTPRVPGSRYEKQSECPRICNVAKIKYKKTGEIIRVFNLHLDHEYEEAKVAGIKCVLDAIEKYQKEEPHEFVITGDFNAEPHEEAKRLCDEFEGITEMTGNIPYTLHDYGATKVKLDYIYLTNKLKNKFIKNGTWEDSYNGVYISDHHAVYVILKD